MNREFQKRKQASVLGTLMIVFCLGHITQAGAAEPGEQEYNTFCGICHTIGGGVLIGPDLAGIHDRQSQEWLEQFVESSQTVINSGDAYATALYEKFNKIAMPDAPVPAEKVKDILNYILSKSAQPVASGAAAPAPAAETPPERVATEEDILLGQNLFQGLVRFENNGASCISCHHVNNDAIIGGGILALELTQVFTKLGGNGVRAVLDNTPFPVMGVAYKDKALSENEVFALVSFLQRADDQHLFQKPKDYGTGLLLSGLIGTGVLLLFYSMLWLRRKKASVNQQIFDRQIKSS